MTGVPTQFAVAELVLEALRENGEPIPDLPHLPFFYLGSVGPALGDFLPTRIEAGDSTDSAPLYRVWLPVLRLLAGTRDEPGLAANLRTLRHTLRRFGDAVRAHDKFALLDMRGDLEALPGLIDRIRAQVAAVDAARARVRDAVLEARPLPRVAPGGDRHARDALHDHRTGTFWGILRRRASESDDPRLRAFGLGVSVGYAGALCGNPFLSGVVGAPFRNHWWRHRWVSHYVDAWVWGYYRTRPGVRAGGREIVFSNNGRVPVPPYAAWEDIAGAELQARFTIGGITAEAVLQSIREEVPTLPFLPEELVTLLLECYGETYGDPASLGIDATGLQGAYALTWLTTWVASSAGFLGATAPHRVDDPDGCGERPAWVEVDGSVVVGGTLVPPPQVERPSPSVPQLVSAIVAAILAVVNFVVGNLAGGVALIVAAVALVDDATDPDWDDLRCHAGWVDTYVARLDNAFRDLLSAAALAPPYAVQLAHNEIQFQTWGGLVVPPSAALRTCRSPSDLEPDDYPASVWQPLAAGEGAWTRYPTEPPELPDQVSYPEGRWWPLHFVDGWRFVDAGPAADPRFPGTQDNPLAGSGGVPTVLDPSAWDELMALAEVGDMPQRAFGNAVDVALALVRAPDDDLLDWDLDGDRGVGWPTWVWASPAGIPGAIVRE